MASEEKSLLAKLTDQKKTEQTAIDDVATPEPGRIDHRAKKAEIELIEAWFSSELTAVRASPDKTKIRAKLTTLVEDLKVKIIGFGQKWHLTDLVYKTVGIPEVQEKIKGQVEHLRKHVADARARKPGVTGDGHSKSAAAAESFGWMHASGMQHRTRAVDAEAILTAGSTRWTESKRNMAWSSRGSPSTRTASWSWPTPSLR